MKLGIDPVGGVVDGQRGMHATYTGAEFAQLESPACPVCGATVTVQRIDITPDAEYEAQHGRLYITGLAECPHHCDIPRGERRHFGQSVRYGREFEGAEATCTCGDVTIITSRERGRAWAAKHHRPGGDSAISFV